MRDVDLLLIGGGPANIAFAVALEECEQGERLESVVMLEKDDSISWHRNMLFDSAVSQVSFLKDLVTLRDPTSRFTFLNYLHEKGRLEEFVNLMSFFPYRREIADYLQWAADKLTKTEVKYGQAVEEIQPVQNGDGTIQGWQVTTSTGTAYRAKRLVFGAGRDAHVPPLFAGIHSDRLFHSAQFLAQVERCDPETVGKIAVIGGAQSGAEIFQACIEKFPTAQTSLIMRSVGLSTYGGSKFINRVYQNDYIDRFYEASDQTKQRILKEMHLTNYSGVSASTMESLFRFHYLQALSGKESARMLTQCELTSAREHGNKIALSWNDKVSNTDHQEEFDLVILATGYENRMPTLLNSVVQSQNGGAPTISRAYKLGIQTTKDCSVHVQGISEASHGISDTLLSVISTRARRILLDILEHPVVPNSGGCSVTSPHSSVRNDDAFVESSEVLQQEGVSYV
ncbi:lysine N(6)-hydroxylase/L-ornithine N(5)-oxygenase family protein [Burkholderia sp. AU30280]|uniref:SidA/IucD/PvdA family monooxygenase n=1 Tax=Burkholderia sp. AU30280 TaxID=2879628 RepID=UPI001CF0F169|nr:SidA/IucD/PvdA family monooxygenase [Burkholderia sp. AU30280]MCA8276391.1 lysine N(6)-hydroxylase/L-ornithine N(5)-oxygenase family protein [Burkholderia sp. AU30280]